MKNSNLPNINSCSIAVIGLGYVGFPLAYAIAKRKISLIDKKLLTRKVFGYDLDKQRISELKNGLDRNKIIKYDKEDNFGSIFFTDKSSDLNDIDIFIITVPTPLKDNNEPELSHIVEASKMVGKAIKLNKKSKDNQIVIFESTVYPGATEEICVPLISEYSGKSFNCESYENSFYCGYSPERINPGDKEKTINSIVKVTSGSNKIISAWIDNFYKSFIEAGTFNVSSIKVAEAAKIIENTQRDINIALVNELSILFKKMNININEILDAADTKWNFQKYRPGLVGGHCIGVDPYYLTFKARKIGLVPDLILAGRKINDNMHEYLLEQILLKINNRHKEIKFEKVLILGISYKSNCPDIRNSQLINLVKNMIQRKMNITIVDPLVNQENLFSKTGLSSLSEIPKNKKYSLIIFALDHEQFDYIDYEKLKNLSTSNSIIFDLTNKVIGKDIYHF